MRQPGSPMLWLVGLAAVLLSACSGASTPTPTTSPTPRQLPRRPRRRCHPTRWPSACSASASGRSTSPPSRSPRLKNEATYHGALGVKVHFVTHKGGKTLGSLDSVAVNLGPGETLAVSADCTDACNGATSVVATVTVGSWSTSIGPIFTTKSAALQLPAVPLRSWLRQRDRDAHTVIRRVIRGSRGGVRRLREQGRARSSEVASRSSSGSRDRPFQRTCRSSSTPLRPPARSGLPPAGRKRSLRLSDLQAQVPVVVRSAAARIPRLSSRRDVSRGAAGVGPLSSPVRGEMAGARPKRSDPPCIYPSGHVDWSSAASCWWPDLQPQCSSRRPHRVRSPPPPWSDRLSVTSTA